MNYSTYKGIDRLNVFELIELERKITRSICKKIPDIEVQKLLKIHKSIIQRLTDYAIRDPLTGLLNRNGYESLVHGFVSQGIKLSRNFAHIIFDIDDFKQVNTKYGHDVGDKVLQNTARIIISELEILSYRGSYAALLRAEHPVRMGGEEIAILLPNRSTETGFRKAEAIRKSIERSYDKELPKITISGGVVSLETVLEAYKAASIRASTEDLADAVYIYSDYALYHSKDAGKNRATKFEEAILERITPKKKKKLGKLLEPALAYAKSYRNE
jgi:diguanylate cyclase (GGDEF)-like protein